MKKQELEKEILKGKTDLNVSTRVSVVEFEELERLSKVYNVSKSELMRGMIKTCINELNKQGL